MLNVQALTQTLSAMPLQQLQQYASLHKNDPYVVTMALSIANQKKQAMAAQQGQAGQQPQPKVVDQEVAGIAPQAMPENVGIGQLPAQNMQGMADGGIVGYAGNGPSLVDPNDYWNAPVDTDEGIRTAFRPTMRVGEEYTPSLMGSLFGYNVEAPAPSKATMPAAGYVRSDPRAAAYAADVKDANAAALGGQPPAPVAPPNTGIGQLPTGAGAMRMPSQADHFKQYQEILAKTKAEDPAEAERKALGAEMVSQTERRQKAYDEEQAARGDVYKGREERLSKQEAEITGRKATNEGLAFLNAGLAIMSTPGGLAMAIGKGARVGTEQYAAGLEKIQAAQDKLGEARDRLDDLRINRADLTAKERRDLQAQADTAKLEAKKLTIDGIMSAANVSEKRAATMFDASVKYGIAQLEQSGANARANMQVQATLATPERMVFNQLLAKHKGDAAGAQKELQEISSTKFNVLNSYSDYLKAFAGKDTVTPPLSFDQYAAQFTVPTVKTLPTGASVLKQPG